MSENVTAEPNNLYGRFVDAITPNLEELTSWGFSFKPVDGPFPVLRGNVRRVKFTLSINPRTYANDIDSPVIMRVIDKLELDLPRATISTWKNANHSYTINFEINESDL